MTINITLINYGKWHGVGWLVNKNYFPILDIFTWDTKIQIIFQIIVLKKNLYTTYENFFKNGYFKKYILLPISCNKLAPSKKNIFYYGFFFF